MQEPEQPASASSLAFLKKFLVLLVVSTGIGWAGRFAGFSAAQQVTVGVFFSCVLGTVLFWNLRLSIAFLGVCLLVLTRSLTIEEYVWAAEVPVILFLIGMMIVLGCLEDLGFFSWVVQSILALPRMSGRLFITVVCLVAALLACLIDEVTSIIIIATLVFQVCNRLQLGPRPYIIIAVIATNIGSAGTMMGNPVGILIGAKAGFTFGDFIVWAFPVMALCTLANLALILFWFRKELHVFNRHLADHAAAGGRVEPGVRLPYKRSLFILGLVLLCIALHHQAERLLGLQKNAVLFLAPVFCAAGVMLYRRDRARHYVEHSVDLWTLLFFMMFFSIAGSLKASGVTGLLAERFSAHVQADHILLVPGILFVSAIGSAFVDNVVFVAAFSPIIESLKSAGVAATPLWWALLFGACFGGNITLIGSTANIVALGMLEKQARLHIRFIEWLKIGLVSALLTCSIAAGAILLVRHHMPETRTPSAPAALPAGH